MNECFVCMILMFSFKPLLGSERIVSHYVSLALCFLHGTAVFYFAVHHCVFHQAFESFALHLSQAWQCPCNLFWVQFSVLCCVRADVYCCGYPQNSILMMALLSVCGFGKLSNNKQTNNCDEDNWCILYITCSASINKWHQTIIAWDSWELYTVALHRNTKSI